MPCSEESFIESGVNNNNVIRNNEQQCAISDPQSDLGYISSEAPATDNDDAPQTHLSSPEQPSNYQPAADHKSTN